MKGKEMKTLREGGQKRGKMSCQYDFVHFFFISLSKQIQGKGRGGKVEPEV